MSRKETNKSVKVLMLSWINLTFSWIILNVSWMADATGIIRKYPLPPTYIQCDGDWAVTHNPLKCNAAKTNFCCQGLPNSSF